MIVSSIIRTSEYKTSTYYLFLSLFSEKLSQCEKDRAIASEPTSFDMFKPECNSDGSYKEVQCFQHTAYGKWCWCADQLGQEIIGTRVENSTLTIAQCKKAQASNQTKDVWTAFYHKPTKKPKPPVVKGHGMHPPPHKGEHVGF